MVRLRLRALLKGDLQEGWLHDLVALVRPAGLRDARPVEPLEELLRHEPEMLSPLQERFWKFLADHHGRSLLAEGGLQLDGSFFSSVATRLLGRLLPPPPRPGSLHDEVGNALTPQDATWLQGISDAELARLARLLVPPPGHHVRAHLWHQLLEALDIVSHRLAAQSLDSEVQRSMPELLANQSPFLSQTREVAILISGEGDGAHLLVLLNQCSDLLKRARRRAATHGTSLHLTYTLYAAEQSLERLRALVGLVNGSTPQGYIWRFFADLLAADARRHSVRDLIAHNASVLALRVTHHAGQTGHHYIAETVAGLRRLFARAAGAGVIVAFMAMIKTDISNLHLAPFTEDFLFSLNYAGGFLLVQLLGFTIATKQPAMTAATLAASLSEEGNTRNANLKGLADKCRSTLRSQFTAICGNVLLALPFALFFSWLWELAVGVPLAGEAKAEHMLHDLSPIHSLALFHAALAGVGLFVSGLVSGYVDNLSAYLQLSERLRHSRFFRYALGRRISYWARQLERQSGALTGNIFLGFYLGSLGTLGAFVGLPLDIRHVSFAAANLGYAWHTLPLGWADLLQALVGVALIGMVNLAVSFGLALWLAMRARGIAFSAGWKVARLVFRSRKEGSGRL